MIAESASALTRAPATKNAATTGRVQPRASLLTTLAALIQRVAESPRTSGDSERYWSSIARGL